MTGLRLETGKGRNGPIGARRACTTAVVAFVRVVVRVVVVRVVVVRVVVVRVVVVRVVVVVVVVVGVDVIFVVVVVERPQQ